MYRKDHILPVNERNGWNKKVNRMCWDEDKSNSPAKKKISKWVAEKYSDKQVTYNLKKSKETQCAAKVLHDEKKSSLPSKQRSTKICVTIKVHIENQANSHSETVQATASITRGVHMQKTSQLTP